MVYPPLDELQAAKLQETASKLARAYILSLPEDHRGRYSKLADDVTIGMLFRGAAAGLPDNDACQAAGLHPTTLQRWQQIANEDPNSINAAFSAELKSLRSNGKLAMLERIRAAADKPQHWTAGAWVLERGDPEHWGQRRDTDANIPRIVVQIGVRDSDVSVALSSAPLLTVDTQVVSMSGSDNRILCTPASVADVCVAEGTAQPMPEPGTAQPSLSCPPVVASESSGGPYPRVRVQGGHRANSLAKVSSRHHMASCAEGKRKAGAK